VTRANADKHLAFGAGIHYCLGAPLARLEGEIAIGALLRRVPRLALVEEPTWRRNLVLRGMASLRVASAS
jgi:cytochrome P450